MGGIYVAADYTHTALFRAISRQRQPHRTHGGHPGGGSDLGAFNGDVRARKLYPLKAATYFIATNPEGEPALYRLELDVMVAGPQPKRW